MKTTRILPCLVAVLFLILGCSGGSHDGDSILPDNGKTNLPKEALGKSNLGMLAFYTVSIDRGTGAIEAVPHRGAQDVLNVLGFLEPPALENLTIDFKSLEVDPAGNYVGVDVILTHPLDSNYFTGFEVRGVVFGPEVTNADGSTRWLNPSDFSDLPWGYTDGMLGTPDSYAHYADTYNGYKLFTDAYPMPMRDADWNGEEDVSGWDNFDLHDTSFGAGESKSAHYDLDFGDDPLDFLIFNYAVIANYAFPTGPGPWNPEDFPLNAHCPEPFLIGVEMYDNESYWDMGAAGGHISMGVRVHDWVNPTADVVQVSIPGLGIPAALPSSFIPCDDGISGVFLFDLAVTSGSGVGYYPMTVRVTDPMTYGQAYFLDGMPTSHSLYNEHISVTISTQILLNDVDIFVDPYQMGYLYYDSGTSEGGGHAAYAIRVEWPGIKINSVELDTTKIGMGVQFAYAPKGDAGYIFPLNNDADIKPGKYAIQYAVHFANGWNEFGDDEIEIYYPPQVPPPVKMIPVAYGGGIGSIHLNTFAEATCGVNINKTFESNGTPNDCAEYQWIQVITTNAPLNGGSDGGYVDPNPNDDGEPFYWTDDESDDHNTAGAGQKRNPAFSDAPRRPASNIPPNPDPTWWHAELILVCVRLGQPDVLLNSEHYFYFKHADGTVDSGQYEGEDGGSEHARGVIGGEFPGYDFE